jgi:hypothetical protein
LELVVTILIMMGQVLVYTFTSPFFLGLLGLLFLMVAWQYNRQEKLSASLIDGRPGNFMQSALRSTLLGLLGGILGSILLVFLGVDLSSISITALWMVALVLMLIQPRFLCFAYAAGVLAITNLLFGFPHTSIPQLMGLVAILHMIESLLILLNGSFHPPAVYIKRQGQLCGGFNLQLFWPIPLLALMSVGFPDVASSGTVMPQWWPLLKDYASFADHQAFTILPVMAVLGYGEICTTRTPRQASRRSSLLLFLFSLTLLLIALLSSRMPIFLPLAAIFSPLGHEVVIWLGMRAETRPPLYVPAERGLMLLEVVPGSSGAGAGLKSGDIILQANGGAINHYQELQELLKNVCLPLQLEIERAKHLFKLTWRPGKGRNIGVVPVPEPNTRAYLVWQEDRYFVMVRRIWQRLKA